MKPMNVYPASSTVPIFFDSFKGSDGSSITISGLSVTDIEIYKGTSMTQRSSDNGYALIDTDGIDLDGITGIHGFSIDLSDNTDAGFYAVGSFYHVVVSAITVDSVTVSFIADRFRIAPAEGITGTPKVDVAGWLGTAPSTPGTAGVPSVDVIRWTNEAVPATASTGVPKVNTTHAAGTAWASGAITANAIASDAITAAKIADGAIDAATFAASAITASAIAADAITAAKIADGAIDAATFAAGAITATVIADGAIDRATFASDTGLVSVRSNTAQAGGASTITLDASASAVDNFYANQIILLTGGTGVGQSKIIASYVGATKVATVNDAWATNPDNTSTFAILPFGSVPGATAPTAVQIRTEMDNNSTKLAAISADTDDIQTRIPAALGANGNMKADVRDYNGTAGTFAAGIPEVKVNNIAASAITAASIATDAIGSAELSAAAANKIADHVNRRTQANVEASSDGDTLSARSLYGAAAMLVNKVSISGTTLTVTKSDDTTALTTKTLVTDAAALPITSADPA